MKDKLLKSYNLFLAIMAILIIVTIFVPPISVMQDTGEYYRTFERVGLYNADGGGYAIDKNASASFAVASDLITRMVVNITSLFGSVYFSITALALIYVIIFLAAMYFIMKSIRFDKGYLNYIYALLLTIVFCDLGYIAYFKSFYSFAFDFVIILALVAIMIGCRKKRIVSIICAALLVVCAFSSLYLNASSGKEINKYNAVFYGALKDSEDPQSDAASLGLTGVESAVGKSYFDVGEKEVAYAENVSYLDIARFYITHPKAFMREVKVAVDNSYFLVQDYLSYGDGISSGIWNYIKKVIMPKGFLVTVIFFVAYIVMAIVERKKYKQSGDNNKAFLAALSLVLPICAAVALIETIILYGEAMISKNLFIYGIFFDMMVIVTVLWVIDTAVNRRQNIKTKYGVNQ